MPLINNTFRQTNIKFLYLLFSFFVLLLSTNLLADGKSAKRIIALSPHAVEMLFAIGAGDKIVATLEYSDYPKQALSIPRIGNYAGIQIERLLELQPDLVIGWKGGNKTSDLDKIKSLGIKLVYTQPKNISDIMSDLKTFGRLTDRQEQAQIVIDKMQQRYQLIRQKYRKQSAVNVFYQLWHDPLQSVGADSWIESLIQDCGGNNIFRDAGSPYPMISLESVIVKNPEVIIIPHHSGSKVEKLNYWSKWPEISAVKSGNIFAIDADLIHRFTPRSLDGLELMCKKINQGRKN